MIFVKARQARSSRAFLAPASFQKAHQKAQTPPQILIGWK